MRDFLDCVGVKLYANYNDTRKYHAEALIDKVRSMVNVWRSGKFMELLDRAIAMNSNILGKLWYCAASVSLRQSDFKTITKLVKQYIYQDLQVRSSDQALYCPVLEGGLGLLHTESRCQALLAISFIETVFGGKYSRNVTNAELYRQKVLKEDANFKIEFSPFYNSSFFENILYMRLSLVG